MRTVTAEEYMALERPETDWLIEGLLPAQSFSLLIGEPKAGKSYFALQLCAALSLGTPFLGCRVKEGAKILYVNLDAADASWNKRLKDMYANGFNMGTNLHFLHPKDNSGPVDIMGLTFQRGLRETIDDLRPDLIVIDVLRELHRQKEESSTEMKTVLDAMLNVTGKCAVLGVHHTVKISNKEDIRIIDLARGSSYLTGKAETVWCLMDNTFYAVPRFAEKTMLKGTRPNGLWNLPPLHTATLL